MEPIRPADKIAEARLNEAAANIERDAALDVAADQALNADIADAQAVDARLRAQEATRVAAEMATDRNVVRHQLAHERAAAESNAFGFYLTLGILVAGLLVSGLYLYWRNSNPDSVSVYASSPAPATTSAPNPPTVVTTPPPVITNPPPVIVNPNPPATAPGTMPSTNDSRPPVIHVNPPAVHNDIHVTTPPGPSGANGTSGPDANGTDSGSNGSGGASGSSANGGSFDSGSGDR